MQVVQQAIPSAQSIVQQAAAFDAQPLLRQQLVTWPFPVLERAASASV